MTIDLSLLVPIIIIIVILITTLAVVYVLNKIRQTAVLIKNSVEFSNAKIDILAGELASNSINYHERIDAINEKLVLAESLNNSIKDSIDITARGMEVYHAKVLECMETKNKPNEAVSRHDTRKRPNRRGNRNNQSDSF